MEGGPGRADPKSQTPGRDRAGAGRRKGLPVTLRFLGALQIAHRSLHPLALLCLGFGFFRPGFLAGSAGFFLVKYAWVRYRRWEEAVGLRPVAGIRQVAVIEDQQFSRSDVNSFRVLAGMEADPPSTPNEHMWKASYDPFLVAVRVARDSQGSALTLVDLGAGSGVFEGYLRDREMRIVCVDISPQALALVQRGAFAEGYKNIEGLLGDIHRLPLQSGSVDIVVARQSLEHCRDIPGVFGEIQRVLRSGGRAYISVPNGIELTINPFLLLDSLWRFLRDGPVPPPQTTYHRGLGLFVIHQRLTARELSRMGRTAGLVPVASRTVGFAGYCRALRYLPSARMRRRLLEALEAWCAACPGIRWTGRYVFCAFEKLPQARAEKAGPMARAAA